MGFAIAGLTVRASPTAAGVVILGLVTAWVVLERPEVGALGVVCLALVVPREILFDRGLPVGSGSLKVTDVLVVLSLGGWIAHRATDPRARRLPSAPVTALILTVVAIAAGSLAFAHVRGGSLQMGLTDCRPLLSLLLVFPLVAFLGSAASLSRALGAVLAACTVGSAWILVLFVFGEGSQASFSGGALRVTEVAFVAPLIGAVWALVLLPNSHRTMERAGAGLLACLSLAALFFTLQRAAWIALLGAMVVAALLMTPRRRAHLLSGMVVLLACVGLAIVGLNAASSARVENPLGSGLERIQSVGAYSVDVSALHREAELRASVKEIRGHPLTGIGLGETITFYSPFYNASTDLGGVEYTTAYIHNSYTWLALKMGLPGLLAFAGIVGWAVVRGTRLARSAERELVRLGALGAVASLAALAAVSFTGPHITSDLAVPYVAAMIAGIDILQRMSAGHGRTDGE